MGSTIEPLGKAKAEKLIRRMRIGFVEGMRALIEVRDSEAWREVGYKSFEACLGAELGVSVDTAYRMVDQAEITLELEAARPPELPRARGSSKPVSQRQGKAAKADPELLEDAKANAAQGADPAEAMRQAQQDRKIVDIQSRPVDPKPWDGQRATAALVAVVDELVAKLGVGKTRSALRDQDDRIKRAGEAMPVATDSSTCEHARIRIGNGGLRLCCACNAVVPR